MSVYHPVSVWDCPDYRDILKRKLKERVELNPRYSLRAFSRDLGIAPSRISAVLNHKQGLSRHYAISIARRIGLEGEEVALFSDLVERAHARSEKKRKAAEVRLIQRKSLRSRELGSEQLEFLSQSPSLTVFCRLFANAKKPVPIEQIAAESAVTVEHARKILLKLSELGLATSDVDGQWKATSGYLKAAEGAKTDVFTHFHEQLMALALGALKARSQGASEFSSAFLLIDTHQLHEAQEEIRAFKRRFLRKFGNTNAPEAQAPGVVSGEAYGLALQLFRL